MLRWLANYFTRIAVGKQSSLRQKHFLSWDKVERLAVIIENSNNLNKSQLDRFIEETKKYTDVFLIELSSKQPSFADWQCFTKKDKNILGLPKALVIDKLKNSKYDLVINATGKYHLYASNLTSLLNAGYKCGNTDLYGELDLIIEKKNTTDLLSYLKEVRKYLEMIKTA